MRLTATAAQATALLALIISMTSTAVAVTQINGSDITLRSIPGNRLKADTVTGTEVRESTLAGAPRRVHALQSTGSDVNQMFYKRDGLQLRLHCFPTVGDTEVQALATGNFSASYNSYAGNFPGDTTADAHSVSGVNAVHWTAVVGATGTPGGSYGSRGTGVIVYTTDTRTTTITFTAGAGQGGGDAVCSFDGIATTVG